MEKTRPLAVKASPTGGSPSAGAILEILKPVTWFAPMWAFACGAVAASDPGAPFPYAMMLAGVLLAGPLVCGASQAMNDWCDRHVDAINQPERPIPSGRLPGRTGFYVAVGATLVSLGYAALLGPLVLAAAALALLSGWAYSAPPLRLKTSGWWGAGLTGLSYEGLAWITGSLVIGGGAAMGRPMLVLFAVLYSIGAHGIMTLNDFKAVEGDREMGIASLPVTMGVDRAVRLACAVMLVPQLIVAALLFAEAMPVRGGAILLLALGQLALMRRLVRDPVRFAPWYNGTGVVLYVAGMMVAAFAVRASL
ncbi:chlorophyll synthase ChlG [Novosphingopyxis sp. YJ-S2-01]|nr:chlorophyll synthase ChlG [Novosphingopyxis sp. YJ-S2-01]MBH9536750.1 chlorophyll synthase ChlG [Novosphingopyxis sp. YJ-S2-01]